MDINQDRLLSQLNQSGLQIKDNPLYQVIKQLIAASKQFQNELESISSSSSSTTVITKESSGLPGMIGMAGKDGLPGPPGIKGVSGSTGATGAKGPTTLGPMGLHGKDGLQGFPIPGNRGNTGATGPTGITGSKGPTTIGPMGLNGKDGMPGFSIPGPKGADGSSSIAAWEGNIVACLGDGNPGIGLHGIIIGSNGATPTNIGTVTARISYFRLRTAITVANIRWYAIGSTTAIYHIAIYRASDNVRMSADNNPNTVANTWNSIADSFTLDANTLYYCAVSCDTTGTTGGPISWGQSLATASGSIQVLPTSWPGNLDIDLATPLISPYAFAQVAVTAGVLPNPGNAPVALAATITGGIPAIFLDAT